MNDPTTKGAPPGPHQHDRLLPRKVIVTVGVLGPVAALVGLFLYPPQALHWGIALAVIGFACAANLSPLRFGLHDEVNLDDVVLVLALAYLPGSAVAPCLAIGVLVAQTIRRRPPVKLAFNVGNEALVATVAVGTAYSAGFAAAPLEGRALLALVAAVLKTGLAVVLVSLVTARLDRVPLATRVPSLLATALPFAVASAAYGLLTLLAMQQSPWALALAIGLAGLFVLRFHAHADRREDYQRRLVDAALALHHASGPSEVERIVSEAVRDLFGADGVRLAGPSGAFRDGVHADLPGRTERLELVGLPGDLPVATDRRDLLATLGSLVAAALDRLGTLEKLGRESERDALTDAFNRRRFERELRRRVATRQPHLLALVDLDDFKAFNDTYGHPEGDALLRTLVADLRATFRGGDHVFRLGGDEFALLLGEVPIEVAARRLEAFLASREEREEVADGPRSVGLSIGLAGFPQHARDGDEWVRVADAALYRAKRRGGNGIEVAGEEAHAPRP